MILALYATKQSRNTRADGQEYNEKKLSVYLIQYCFT